ncbi:Calcium-dependent protein kinase 2 (PfCDPK2) [Durusdinium trenchii]|uniref:Calcium-dependent protein kinase 2 (PfCDPK2) n=1 Tax=Durusdinium trenchii TaxID=1381693 RepID=A0ABP0M0L7_9DINO
MGCGASASKKEGGGGKKSTTGFASASLIVDNQGKIQQFYDIDKKKIGEGSYGSVCKARNKATKAMRAIKTINKAALKSPEAFKKEIQIMKILDHPNICKLYESFQDHRYIYLVLELCTGGELFDRIIEYGHLTEKQAALLMQNMFRAIYYMHQSHYTHRDLKPENFIFTTKEGSKTRKFPVLAGKYDHMADMWSLGVIMYVMLCGYPPFYGESDQEVLDEVRQGKVKFQAADWKNVSEDAKALIKNLLQMNPKDRYSAEQALNDVWIKEKAPKAKDVNLQDGFVDKLRGFLSQNKLKKAALQVIASSLDDKQIQALRETFQALDENGDGLLTAAELKAGLEKGGLKDIPGDLQEIMRSIDADGSGVIDYTEFLAATLDRKHFIEEDACWQAFRVFDRDGNGTISQKELAEVLASDDVAGKFHKETQDLMKMVDTNGDGEIDFQEFMQMMRS